MANKHTKFVYAPPYSDKDWYQRTSDGSWYVPEKTPGRPSHLFEDIMNTVAIGLIAGIACGVVVAFYAAFTY